MGSEQAVEIEDRKTWPKELNALALAHEPLILSYYREEKRVDRLSREDLLVRFNPPLNPHKAEYKWLVAEFDEVLSHHRFVGYHCTRLTSGEIENIKEHGMRTLSESLIQDRLDHAFSEKHLSQQQYSYLRTSASLQSNLTNKNGARTSRIWFSPNRSTLKVESDVFRLFRSWGGEALYRGHEEDPLVVATLRCTGMPCIVKCKIPFGDAKDYRGSYGERFLSQFISKKVKCPDPSPAFDMFVERDLDHTEVLAIFDINNPRFEKLTGYSHWGGYYKIV